jgi:hypothetical protein
MMIITNPSIRWIILDTSWTPTNTKRNPIIVIIIVVVTRLSFHPRLSRESPALYKHKPPFGRLPKIPAIIIGAIHQDGDPPIIPVTNGVDKSFTVDIKYDAGTIANQQPTNIPMDVATANFVEL